MQIPLLYGDWNILPDYVISTFEMIINNKSVPNLYQRLSEYEKENKGPIARF